MLILTKYYNVVLNIIIYLFYQINYMNRKEIIDNKSDLRLADLRLADLRLADLRLADLRSADLSSADLSSADLRLADLRLADLRLADLRSANLRLADLSSADLSSADLSLADLSSANLSLANLSSADLRLADLRLANLSSAKMPLYCKWNYSVTDNNIINIGCESRTIKEWDLFFNSEIELTTERGTDEFKQIQAIYEACKAYLNFLNK